MRPLINPQEFIELSSLVNYQLAGEPVNWAGVLSLIVEGRLEESAEDYFVEVLNYLDKAYGQQKRRLGPLAILHPIRTASLLAKAQRKPNTLDLLTALLHDKNEDLTADKYSSSAWLKLEKKYSKLLEEIDSNANWFLNERIAFLAKSKGQKYTEYLGKVLAQSRITPELASVKLADRLDNTLDLQIDLQDVTNRSNTFQIIFDILYANSYSGLHLRKEHPIARKINDAMRLYQLHKNAVLLSMIRRENIPMTGASKRLFYSLGVASIREAQTITMHIFGYDLTSPDEQRDLLLEVMDYSHEGGLERINVSGSSPLDGAFLKYFVHQGKESKQNKLDELYYDKRQMALLSLAFLAIFANFLNSDKYMIKGISAAGIVPHP